MYIMTVECINGTCQAQFTNPVDATNTLVTIVNGLPEQNRVFVTVRDQVTDALMSLSMPNTIGLVDIVREMLDLLTRTVPPADSAQGRSFPPPPPSLSKGRIDEVDRFQEVPAYSRDISDSVGNSDRLRR